MLLELYVFFSNKHRPRLEMIMSYTTSCCYGGRNKAESDLLESLDLGVPSVTMIWVGSTPQEQWKMMEHEGL